MKNKRDNVLIIAPSYYGIDSSIAKAFEKNGYKSFMVNYKVNSSFPEKIIRKAMTFSPSTNRALHPYLRVLLLKENKRYIALAEKHRPSFIFIIKGESVFPQTLGHIKEHLTIPCISYQWDDPFYTNNKGSGLDDYRRNNFRLGMKDYDHIFAFDNYYVDEIKKEGISNVSYLPLATDEDLYKNTSLTEDEKKMHGYDICFVGMPFNNRIDVFNELQEFNLGVFGDFWDMHRDRLKGNYFKGPATGDKVLKIYSASKIVMNINHPHSVYGVNTRTFDILSCGAFEIMDYKQGIEDLFDVGNEIVCYHDVRELKALVRYYLDHPAKRKDIAEKGCLKTRKQHTWAQRVKEIITVLQSKKII
jgi:spore maturation protein CgeB